MPELDETVANDTASDIEQPVESNAVEAGTEEVQPEQAPAEAETVEAPKERLYAGKYKTAEELEEAYRNSNAESSRMAAELAKYRQPQPAKPEPAKPQYTAEQLESYKEGHLRQIARAEAQAMQAYASGNHAEARQIEAQSQESARQIRLIDAELRRMDIESSTRASSSQAAKQRLQNEAVEVLRQYQGDLVPGTDLHSKASEFLSGFEAMGMDGQDALVQAQAVSMAAQVLGLSSKKVAQTTRKELTKNINQALKQGVQPGGGKATKSAAAPDFSKMSDAEFIKYKQSRGWD